LPGDASTAERATATDKGGGSAGLIERHALGPSDDHKAGWQKSFPGRVLGMATVMLRSVIGYLLAVLAVAGIGAWFFPAEVRAFWEEQKLLGPLVLLVVPIVLVLLPASIAAVRHRRAERLLALGFDVNRHVPGYFRLEPYDAQDAQSFTRADGAHERITDWLDDGQPPQFRYLTGDSGVGKTSLLHAAELPALRERGWAVVAIRAYSHGERNLAEALRANTSIWERPPRITDPRRLLEEAAKRLGSERRRLLVVVDQFEELFILDAEAELGMGDKDKTAERATARAGFVALLRDLDQKQIPGLLVLVAMRKDYEDNVVEHFGLPWLRQHENRRTIEPFENTTAKVFLRDSGLPFSDDLLRRLLNGAAKIEERRGLFRPVVLNLLGLVRSRYAEHLPAKPEALIAHHLREALDRPSLRDLAPRLLDQLITEGGTARAVETKALAEACGRPETEIKGALRMLRDDGLVRPVDGSGGVWQVAHDFIANQLSVLLGRLRPPWWRRAAPYATPVLAATWLAVMVGAFWVVPGWQHDRAFRSLVAHSFSITGDRESGYVIRSGSGTRAGALERLGQEGHHLGHIRELWIEDHADAEDFRALAASTGFRRLAHLSVRQNSSLRSLDGLPDVPSLTSLEVRWNYALISLDDLPDMPKLNTLEVRGNEWLVSLNGLPDMPNLTSLSLDGDALTSLDGLPDMPKLTSLSLSGALLTSLDGLPDMPNLTSLELSHNHALTSLDGLPEMPNLTSLAVSWNDALASLDGLPETPRLEVFVLSSSSKVAASAIVAAMTSLERLELRLPNAGDVLVVAATLPELKELELDHRITDAMIDWVMAERRKLGLAEPTISYSFGIR
jgi:hypothetical protein